MRELVAMIEKRASVSEDTRARAFKACATFPKTATVDDRSAETSEEARLRRVGEFLRRRAPSSLENGSASPTPPKDATP